MVFGLFESNGPKTPGQKAANMEKELKNMTNSEIDHHREIFEYLDREDKGSLPGEDFGYALRLVGLNPTDADADALLEECSLTIDDDFTLRDYCYASCLLKSVPSTTEKQIKQAFSAAGGDPISIRDLEDFLQQNGDKMTADEVDDFVLTYTRKGDNRLDSRDFFHDSKKYSKIADGRNHDGHVPNLDRAIKTEELAEDRLDRFCGSYGDQDVDWHAKDYVDLFNSRKHNTGGETSSQRRESLNKRKSCNNVIIAGAPASGKGTQCELIVQNHGLVHVSTGDLLREEVKNKTKLGKEAAKFMNAGKLVPDDVVIGMVKERLGRKDAQTKGWLLDGFPRTAAQAKALENEGLVPDLFLELDVPERDLVERVVGRRLDPETGKIYHVKFNPAKDKKVQKRLIQRDDDTEEKIKVRIEAFHDNIDQIIRFYEKQHVTIDGLGSKDEIFKDIDVEIRRLQ